jgi:hypothetical protein
MIMKVSSIFFKIYIIPKNQKVRTIIQFVFKVIYLFTFFIKVHLLEISENVRMNISKSYETQFSEFLRKSVNLVRFEFDF